MQTRVGGEALGADAKLAARRRVERHFLVVDLTLADARRRRRSDRRGRRVEIKVRKKVVEVKVGVVEEPAEGFDVEGFRRAVI